MIKPNATILYNDNTSDYLRYSEVAQRVIQAVGLTHVSYCGRYVSLGNSSIASEFRDDLYKSDLVVVHVGSTGASWMLDEIKALQGRGLFCLIYGSESLESFAQKLEQDLNASVK